MFVVLGLLASSMPAPALSQTRTGDMEPSKDTPALIGLEERQTRSLVRSAARIEIRADLRAPLAETPFLEGARFNQGDTLIRFDCSRFDAELAAAKAGANAAWIDYKSKKRLLAHPNWDSSPG